LGNLGRCAGSNVAKALEVRLPVRLRRAAQSEFDEAADWYEARRQGLGLRFTAAVRKVLINIADNPDRWAEIWPGVREAPVSKWPYFIYYQTHPDHVMVLAVFHASRDPAIWQTRA
jgi:plasmid stabilization system protein ParE